MATATAAAPDSKTLRQKLDGLMAQRRTLADEWQRVNGLTSAYVDDRPSASRAEILRARHRVLDLRREIDLMDAATEEVERELRAAEDAARRVAKARAFEQLRPYVPRLDRALSEVEAVLRELVPLDEQAGVGITDAFALLVDDAPRRQGLVLTWRAHARSLGLL